MAWREARAEAARLLETVSITAPEASSIEKAYEKPPASVQTWPAAIIYPPALEIERFGGWRRLAYTSRVRVLLPVGEDPGEVADLVDAFREAVVDLFDDNTTLNGKADDAEIQRVDEAAGFLYGNHSFTGVDCFLRVTMKEGYDFEP